MEAAFIEVAVIKTGEEDPDACLKGVAEKDDETISVFLEPQRGSDNNNESPTTASVVSVAVSETGGECCKVFSHHQSSLGQKLKFTNTKLTLRYQTGEILSLNIKSDSLFSIISETFARVVHNKNYSTKHRGICIAIVLYVVFGSLQKFL